MRNSLENAWKIVALLCIIATLVYAVQGLIADSNVNARYNAIVEIANADQQRVSMLTHQDALRGEGLAQVTCLVGSSKKLSARQEVALHTYFGNLTRYLAGLESPSVFARGLSAFAHEVPPNCIGGIP